jgi:hypothetical protein
MGARFAPNVPEARKSFWTHPVERLGDVGHGKPHFGPFRESVSISAKLVHGLHQRYHRLEIVMDAPDGTPR